MEIKTNRQHLVEIRNKIAGRIMENRANIEYWSWVIKHAKQNSQEIVDAHKNAKLNEGNAEKDLVFLKCIDLMLKKEK